MTKATILAVSAFLLLPSGLALGADCRPDGIDGLLPTFDAEDECGDLGKCEALAQNNQNEEANACERKIEDCSEALRLSNAKAEAHNAALEACRASIPNRQKSGNKK
jgi:hypothetical protein